ncbi:MAG TPA: exopolyphosphatase [Ferruginibacter sp.]|nr:exopolyphosphatase [Ferruginibacter sp.]
MILAAIDIGSNAARLLITEVVSAPGKKTQFNKLNLFRIPLRLGFDVFEHKIIPPEKVTMMHDTMMAFHHLMKTYRVQAYKACATSAMRDAVNAPEIIQSIHAHTGILIEVISGDMEANLIYENHIAENMTTDKGYLYIDVGGGSTELSFFNNGRLFSKRSFNIGTIRLLQRSISDSAWDEMKDHIKEITRFQQHVIAIGSGGNINKIFSLSKKKEGKPLTIELLREYYRELENVSIEERISRYNLKADRADVIVPALSIYINVMRWAGADEIFVPKIGLSDGLIQNLWAGIQSNKQPSNITQA